MERSVLFIPADSLDAAREAATSEADAVILDLEDLLTAERKEPGRRNISAAIALRAERQRWFVRVNPVETALAFDDFEAAVVPGVAGVVVPKVERAEQLAVSDFMLSALERRAGLPVHGLELVGIVESGAAIAALATLAIPEGFRRPLRFGLGTGDLVKDLDLRASREETEVAYFRSALVTASRALRIAPPIDCVWIDIGDEEGLIASTRRGRAFGLKGKFVLTPRQAAIARVALEPTEAEKAQARRILDAYEEAMAKGEGSLLVDGVFVDAPIAGRYRSLLG